MSRRLGCAALLAAMLLGMAPGWAAAAPLSPSPSRAAAAEDIRDIRGPVAIVEQWRWLEIGAGVLGLVAIGAAIAATLHRRRAALPTADERALQRLAEAEALAVGGQANAYAAAASEAVRAYIEERFGLPATHATTDEFLQELAAQPGSPLGEHRLPLAQFLSACDLAKFARLQLPPDGLQSLNELARHFVSTTARPPASAGPAATATATATDQPARAS